MAYSLLKDREAFPNSSDNCQFSPTSHANEPPYLAHNSIYETSTNKDPQTNSKSGAPSCFQSFNFDLTKKMTREDTLKNTLISVEDEIYNLAFKPAKNPRSSVRNSSITQTTTNKPDMSISTTISNQFRKHASINKQLESFNLTQYVTRLFARELLTQEESSDDIGLVQASNTTLNVTISDLKSFGRYIVSIIACQKYSDRLSVEIESVCSKPSMITFRTLPDKELDTVRRAYVSKEADNTFYFNWHMPNTSNGFIYKYNLKFTDVTLNKTHGTLCHGMPAFTANSSMARYIVTNLMRFNF